MVEAAVATDVVIILGSGFAIITARGRQVVVTVIPR